MRRISNTVTVVIALTLTLLICGGCQAARSGGQTSKGEGQSATQQQHQIAYERTVSTQQRINRYFHSDVVPELKSCWSRVQGEGIISIEYTYMKDASGRWVWEGLGVDSSTLPKGQDAIALGCIEESVRGTSFPVDKSDGAGDKFFVTWSWPVPFPANADQQASAMFAARRRPRDGGGGCDGKGAAAKCLPETCSSAPGGRGVCPTKKVCVGWKKCSANGGCAFTEPCASGGPFGVAGGMFIL